MAQLVTRGLVLVLAVVVALLSPAAPAAAVDAPKWVAALYVEAQRAVGMRWQPVPGATAYKVLRSETAGSGYKELASSPQPQYFDKEVEAGSTYFYVLQAVAGAEASANSDEKSVTIPGQKKKAMAVPTWAKDPQVQESTEFGKTSYRVGLVWNRIPEAIAYNVYKSTTPGKDYQMLASVSESQAIDAAVEVGKTYYYTVSALDGSFQETGMSAEKAAAVVAVQKVVKKKAVKLEVKPRAAKKLWQKERGDENGKFDLFEPYDIALDAANNVLYASSNSSWEVYGVNARTGEMVYKIGGKGTEPGQFLYPMGMDVVDGVLYVVDRVKSTVQTFRDGKLLKEFPVVLPNEPKVEGQPGLMDIAVDPKSGDMYIVDRGINLVWVLDDAGKFQRFLGESGTEVGQIKVPFYVAFDPEGNVVVVNANQSRISTYDKESGKHLRSFGEQRPGVGTFLNLSSIAYDKEGNILVADGQAANVQGFLPDGRYLYNLANEKGDGGAALFQPKGLQVDRATNRLYVSEGLVNRLQAFEFTGPVPAPQQEPAE